MTKHVIRGANASFFKDEENHTDSNHGCFRFAYLRSLGIEETTHSRATLNAWSIGHYNETRRIAELEAKGHVVTGEQEVIEPVTALTNFMGHVDIVRDGEIVEELKNITSTYSRDAVRVRGRYKLGNLAQAVSYMVALEKPTGELIYSDYSRNVTFKELADLTEEEALARAASAPPIDRVFAIEIQEEGAIHVDNVDSGFTVQHVLDSRRELAKVLETGEIPTTRPKGTGEWGSDPCHFCPMKATCDSFGSTWNTTAEFVAAAKEIIK